MSMGPRHIGNWATGNVGPMQQGAVRVTMAEIEAAKIPLPVMTLTITLTAEMVDGTQKIKAQVS